MPRPKRSGAPEPKRRSRNGCWPCKSRKVKCGEEKPSCLNCQRQNEQCDYSIRLNWDGRTKRKDNGTPGWQLMSPDVPSSSPQQSRKVPQQFVLEDQSTSLSGSNDGSVYDEQETIESQYQQTLPPIPPFNAEQTRPMEYDNAMQTGIMAMPPAQPWPDLMNPGQPETQPSSAFNSLPQMRQFQVSSYPSPAESFGAYNGNGIGMSQTLRMPPPYPTSNPSQPSPLNQPETVESPSNNAKRVRLSPRVDSFRGTSNRLIRSSSYGPGDLDDVHRPTFQPLTPTFFAQHLNDPPTPAASSTASDDVRARWLSKSVAPSSTTDGEVRRVSVNSLLSNSPEPEEIPPPTDAVYETRTARNSPIMAKKYGHLRHESSHSETYGLDRGQPDLDLPRNNDTVAISAMTPSDPGSDLDSWLHDFDVIPEFAFGLQKRERVFAKGGYYAQPVPIKIPRSLEPLPATLLQNPMNLLYFHHFLNHTARILVPHDCSENPFKTILPKLAVENTNLLNLLLAYSASHRARLLSHPEPANRIALWVRDVFPSLRHALDDLSISNTQISNANLATAIMLSSLEIISPSTFGIPIPWQNHLGIARSIIHARYSAPQSISRKDSVFFFLSRWFAYLDVLGSISGRANDLPLFSGNYWATSSADDFASEESDEDYVIDCLLGMTSRCVSLLAEIACLARQCDNERISPTSGFADPDWRPSPSALARAESLREDLNDARTHINRPCPHRHSSVDSSSPSTPNQDTPSEIGYAHSSTATKGWDTLELLSTNDSFHLAASIHLHRRILFLPRSHPTIQSLVHAIVSNLYKVRKGGTAEACLLFPMFTAGCEALEDGVRGVILERLKAMEEVGLMQVKKARTLMELVWKESDRGSDEDRASDGDELRRKGERGWEELLGGGEFFG